MSKPMLSLAAIYFGVLLNYSTNINGQELENESVAHFGMSSDENYVHWGQTSDSIAYLAIIINNDDVDVVKTVTKIGDVFLAYKKGNIKASRRKDVNFFILSETSDRSGKISLSTTDFSAWRKSLKNRKPMINPFLDLMNWLSINSKKQFSLTWSDK